MTNEQLAQRDYILLVDQSGSMTSKLRDGRTRWNAAKEMTIGLAGHCEQFDKDGITVIPFNSGFKEYENVTDGTGKIEQIWKENSPVGGTDTAGVLKHVLDKYFKTQNAKPITVLCLTDGEPTDPTAVAKVISDATQKMTADEQIGISFLQVGDDPEATKFLKFLDDDLQSKYGAKFDIVDTKTFDELERTGNLTQALIDALND